MSNIREETLSLKIDSTQAMLGAQQFQAAAGGITRSVNTAKIALAALGAAGIGVGGKLIGMASSMQEVQSKFNVVFGGLTGDANKWSQDFGRAVGRSQVEIKRALSGVQDLFVPLGFGRDEAFELSKALTQLSVDVASFNDAADAEVMRDFQSALVGNHETVRRYGVILSESTLEQEAFAQGLNKSYRELSDQQKVLLRYSLLQKGSTDALGDAIRTGDSYANQLKRMKAAMVDIGTEMGENLLPAATKALSGMNEFFNENGMAIKRWADDVVEGVEITIGALKKLEAQTTDIQSLFNRFGPSTQQSILEAYKSQTGESFGMTTTVAPGVMGGAAVTHWKDPKDPAYARKLMESYDRQLQRDYNVTPSNTPSVSPTGGKGLNVSGMLAGNDGASALSGPGAMYPSGEGYEAYMDNMAEQYTRTAESQRDAVDEMDKMEEAARREMEIIGRLGESHERAAEMVEYADAANRAYGKGSDEARRKIEEFEQSVKALEQQQDLVEMADDISQSFGNAFADMVTGAKTAEDAMRSLGRQILATMAQKMIAEPIANAMSAGMSGMFGGLFHTGGIVGETPVPHRMVDSSLFATAPRLHSGLNWDEYPAILQRGEAVIPKGAASSPAAAPNVTFNVTNQSSSEVALEQTNVQWDGKRAFVDMVLKDKRNHGAISRQNRRR